MVYGDLLKLGKDLQFNFEIEQKPVISLQQRQQAVLEERLFQFIDIGS